jgi:hypothetical protein
VTHLGGAGRGGKFCGRRIVGALAQLGEHLLCKQGVTGSIPVRSIFCNPHSHTSLSARWPLTLQPQATG